MATFCLRRNAIGVPFFLELNSAHYHGNGNAAGAAASGGGSRGGIWVRQSGVSDVFCHVKIAAGGHVGLKSPHFVEIAMRLV